MTDKLGLGKLGYLPFEIREKIWGYVDMRGLINVSRPIQRELYGAKTLTFTISSRCDWRPNAWPTSIKIDDGCASYAPLIPAPFVFDSPDPDRVQRFLRLPFSQLQSLRLSIHPPDRPSAAHFIRIFNSLVWLIDFLHATSSALPQKLTVSFEDDCDKKWAAWYEGSQEFSFASSCRDIPPFNMQTRRQYRTDANILVRTLRRLPTVDELTFLYPPYWKQCSRWPRMLPCLQELEKIVAQSEDHQVDWKVKAEEQMLLAFYEMRLSSLPNEGEMFNRERSACWTTHYENVSHARLDSLVLSDRITTPAWVTEAARRIREQRLLARMFNPLTYHAFALFDEHRNFFCRRSYEMPRYWSNREPWEPSAWFSDSLPTCWIVPQFGKRAFCAARRKYTSIPLGSRCASYPWPAGGLDDVERERPQHGQICPAQWECLPKGRFCDRSEMDRVLFDGMDTLDRPSLKNLRLDNHQTFFVEYSPT